jgi:REP element-mobilizing transposase RayT
MPGYDYTRAGSYFVTVCVAYKQCLLGEVVSESVHLTDAGEVVLRTWKDLPKRFAETSLDEFVVMPNHIHGILHLPGGYLGGPGGVALGTVVRTLKAVSTRAIRQAGPSSFAWQPDYWDYIIRPSTWDSRSELQLIRNYICSNPRNWKNDEDHP